MLASLERIFQTSKIDGPDNQAIRLHSNTSKEQGYFIQKILDSVRPTRTLEVGLAYGISTLFILEKHREYKNPHGCHVVIEPFPWGGVAEHLIRQEKLHELADIRYELSDKILPRLYADNHRIQFAYIDTTKLFDTVLQDFYFIDKMLDVNGVIIFDDCGAGCPGVQRVARFVNTLPHYEIFATHNKAPRSIKRKIASTVINACIALLPFKRDLYPTIDFTTDEKLGLDSSCIAFRKVAADSRRWDWDHSF